MKKIFSAFLFICIIIIVSSSCKKDEIKDYFQGGTAPVLSVSSTDMLTLTASNAANAALEFTWTNPNYEFTTGSSSQNVNYKLQIDTTGSNFTNPNIQEIGTVSSVNYSITEKDLNTALTKLNLLENVSHNVEFRIKATLVNNSVPLYSNVIQIVIIPYLDVAVPIPSTGELYITGSAVPSGWTNDPPAATQQCVKVSNTEYYILMDFSGDAGLQYKFLSTLTQWQPQYGELKDTPGTIGYNLGGGSDPDAISAPSEAGTYKIDLNFKTGKYTVTKQ